MASRWAHFRKVWLRPEVYPLIGAMGAALGVMTASLINKASSPAIAWNKSKRGTGGIYDDIEEVVPLWASASRNSTSIFTSDSRLQETNKRAPGDFETFVVKVNREEDEEDEGEEADDEGQDDKGQDTVEQDSVVQDEIVEDKVVQDEFAQNEVVQDESSSEGTIGNSESNPVVHEGEHAVDLTTGSPKEMVDESSEAINAAIDQAITSVSEVPLETKDSHDESKPVESEPSVDQARRQE